VLIGTYSSVYVASPMILHLNLRREHEAEAASKHGAVMSKAP
jgi:preprotein translocase subunit SecF